MEIKEFIDKLNNWLRDPWSYDLTQLKQWQKDFIEWVFLSMPMPRKLGKSTLWIWKKMEYEKVLMEAYKHLKEGNK